MKKQEFNSFLTIDTFDKFIHQVDETMELLQANNNRLSIYDAQELNDKYMRRINIKKQFHLPLSNPQKYRFVITLASILKKNYLTVNDIDYINRNISQFYKAYQKQIQIDNQQLSYFESLIFNTLQPDSSHTFKSSEYDLDL